MALGKDQKFLQLISTYVPPPVLREFTRNPEPVKKNFMKCCEGTVMFAGKLPPSLVALLSLSFPLLSFSPPVSFNYFLFWQHR
jgi:hypothetical protein